MLVIPILQIHVRTKSNSFTLLPFVRSEKGLSVTVGNLVTFAADEFKRVGFDVVSGLLRDYLQGRKSAASQFDKMSVPERITFFQTHVGLLISERGADSWEIDLMRPIGDGSSALPVGPSHRVEFCPSREKDRFFEVIQRVTHESHE
jgi:hypothetical protein